MTVLYYLYCRYNIFSFFSVFYIITVENQSQNDCAYNCVKVALQLHF